MEREDGGGGLGNGLYLVSEGMEGESEGNRGRMVGEGEDKEGLGDGWTGI